jgi:virulence factor Mce-like protein
MRGRTWVRLVGTLCGLAVVAGLLPACSTITGNASGGYKMTAYFPKAVSLYAGSNVRVLGLGAGKVSKVSTEGDQVRVDLTMDKKIVLPAGVQAAIVPQSLIGERYVQLYPAWVQGEPRLDLTQPGNRVIPLSRTSIPVEPDEALAALKHLLDDLDPNAAGRLVKNLSVDLQGNGQIINNAVSSLATLTSTLASKDQQLSDLIGNFANFTSTLDTRESQLGKVLDLFAQTTSLLAQERGSIADLVRNIGDTASNALDLVSKHGPTLQNDVGNLTHLLATLDANLGSISTLLASGPILAAGPNLTGKCIQQPSGTTVGCGLLGAYNAQFRRTDLRSELPLNDLLAAFGLPICIPALSTGQAVTCSSGNLKIGAAAPAAVTPAAGTAGPTGATGATPSTTIAPPGSTTPPTTQPAPGGPFSNTTTTTQPPGLLPPIGGLPDVPVSPLSGVISLLGSGGTASPQQIAMASSPAPVTGRHRSLFGRLSEWSHSLLKGLW